MSRALAHIETVSWEKEIPNADNIKLIGVLGWQLIAQKSEIQVNDKVVYIEIDSLANKDDKRFAFLEPKHYKIKTMKLGAKLGSPISQGLAMPLSLFPELGDPEIGTDVTEQLKITYYSSDDRQRKSNKNNKEEKNKRMMARLHATHPRIANLKLVRKLAKSQKGLNILFFFFGKKKDLPKTFPEWIIKTDETRVENIPWILESGDKWVATEKLDGTSCTFAVDKQKKGYEFIVCSRNIRQRDIDEIPYGDFETNVYLEMAEKYNIKDILTNYAIENNYDRVVIQGECIGETIQGNPYKLKGRELYIFNFIIEGIRMPTQTMCRWCEDHELNHVPVLDTEHELQHTMENMKAEAEGDSVVNPQVKREGIVYRSQNGKDSFKNVSNSYILKHQG